MNDDAKKQNKDNDDAIVQPDPETLHTTDPQENMQGPVSSLVQASIGDDEKKSKNASDKKEDEG